MKFEKAWHLYAFVAVICLVVISFLIGIVSWSGLPDIIPTHFNFEGQPDSWGNKSFLTLFFAPVLQVFMTALFAFIYIKPQYMNMPTTLFLTTLPEKQKLRALGLMRNVAVVTLIWVNILFTYVSYMIVSGAREETLPYQGWVLIGLVAAMLIWLVWYNIHIYRIIKKEFDINLFNGEKVKK